MGAQPRPPQRTLSNSGLSVQRPGHQRSLSQQYLPSSPMRKEGILDLASDSDGSQSRYGVTPRRGGGSRLKLELSNDSSVGPNSSSASPQTLTPSRMMPTTDSPDIGDMSPRASVKGQNNESDNAPLPMPKRQQRFAFPNKISPIGPTTTAPPTKKDTRPKPYSIEIPSAAPRYSILGKGESSAKPDTTPGNRDANRSSNTRHADFFPWTGDHPEDHFTDHVIKQGYYDKAPQGYNESSWAKQTLFPALKHKTGLTALSGIFMNILGQRRHGGQINSPSTFKPPPRVTLTDTKREVWLKDLANPSISLRRLSRTIPHGIRGKVLLDQCLNKRVPTDRAVWLAKCVGANEIRAFKRKGVSGTFAMGGEAKWIRDWTVFVEQFIESIVSPFGEPEWKEKVAYA
jgi:mediator of RNA polymerase II transcription subunit 12, fungi type